jgi:hypothetical protein
LAAGFYLKKSYFSKEATKVLSQTQISEKILAYLKLVAPAVQSEISAISDESGLYKIDLKIGGRKYVSFVSRDGRLLFPQAINLEESLAKREAAAKKKKTELSKSDRPDVKLFVMSYCPYGLQAEKAIMPAWKLLNEQADINVYFVDYTMHGKKEIDENLRQYCLKQEEPDKFVPYLGCFVKDGDSQACLTEVKSDKEKISACVALTDKKYHVSADYNDRASWRNGKYPKFELYSELNSQYNVGGSPTLVINGTVVSPSQRSPEAFKQEICRAFKTAPEQCSQTLSTTVALPDFDSAAAAAAGKGGSCR